jgi:lysine biosynthesis protein LysW
MVNKARLVAKCPDCQSSISLPPQPELWMRVTCPECGTQLEIVDDDPWELDYAEDFEEEEFDDELEEFDVEEFEDDDLDDLDDELDEEDREDGKRWA